MREKIITQELVTECKRLRELGHDEKRIAYEMQLSIPTVKRALAERVSVSVKCGVCGEEFVSVVKSARYCSFDCRYEAQKKRQLERYYASKK